jgi:hypothetical protein
MTMSSRSASVWPSTLSIASPMNRSWLYEGMTTLIVGAFMMV